jgi:Flp pilus assembly protein TadG
MRKAISSRTKLIAALRRVAMDRAGGVAPLLAIGIVPLLMSVGAAVDFSRASADKAAMQSALDSTALATIRAVARGTSVPDAQALFNSLMTKAEVKSVTVTSSTNTTGQGTTATLSAQGTLATDFMRIAGVSQLTLGVNSSAFTQRRTDGCVLALSKTASPAISLSGSTTVGLSDCTLYSNSVSATSVSVGGSASLTADMIGTVGGVSASPSNVTLTEGIATHLAPLIDPYADVQVPAFSGCTDNNLRVKADQTIDQGVYCNGISINAGATLTLNPGVYFIDRGNLTINGGGGLVGTGVTLIFTSSTGANYATASINGNATVNLTAPSSGTTAGIVIMMDRNAPTGTSLSLSGGSAQIFGGAIYAPTGAVSYTGGASTSASCTQIIGDTVTFTGNSNVAINCSSYKTKSFGANTIRLSS